MQFLYSTVEKLRGDGDGLLQSFYQKTAQQHQTLYHFAQQRQSQEQSLQCLAVLQQQPPLLLLRLLLLVTTKLLGSFGHLRPTQLLQNLTWQLERQMLKISRLAYFAMITLGWKITEETLARQVVYLKKKRNDNY